MSRLLERIAPEDCFATPTGALAPAAWDGLVGRHMYSSSSWLGFSDGDAPGTGGVVHTGSAADPRAAVAVTGVRRMGNPFYRWTDLLAARGLPDWGEGALMVGQRRGYRTHVLHRPEVTLDEAASELLPAVRDLAASPLAAPMTGGGPGIPAMFLDTPTVAAFERAGVPASPVLLQLDAWIPVADGGWDGYLAALGTKSRISMARRDRRRFERAGYLVEHAKLLDTSDIAGELQACTDRRYGDTDADGADVAASFAAQARAMGERGEVLLCGKADGTTAGFCLFYEWEDVLYLRAAGFDYDVLEGAAEYFNLVYYLPMEIASARGLRWIHAGIESADAKALRGAELRGLWMLDLSENSVLTGPAADVRAANRAFLARAEGESKAVSLAVTAAVREAVG